MRHTSLPLTVAPRATGLSGDKSLHKIAHRHYISVVSRPARRGIDRIYRSFGWRPLWATLVWTLLALTMGAGAAAASSEPISLGQSIVALDGPWQFHTGDSVRWADPDFDDSQWESVDLTPPPGDRVCAGLAGEGPSRILWLRVVPHPGVDQIFGRRRLGHYRAAVCR